MATMTALWMPILLSAVVVFMISAVIHMMTPWHKGEYPPVPNEDGVMNALRPFAIPPGDYMVPRCLEHKDMQTPEFQEKLKKGPILILTVLPNGPFTMGKQLTQWFVYIVIVSLIAAYVTSRALPVGASYLEVFRFAGVTAFACHFIAMLQSSIWYKRNWATTGRLAFDTNEIPKRRAPASAQYR